MRLKKGIECWGLQNSYSSVDNDKVSWMQSLNNIHVYVEDCMNEILL